MTEVRLADPSVFEEAFRVNPLCFDGISFGIPIGMVEGWREEEAFDGEMGRVRGEAVEGRKSEGDKGRYRISAYKKYKKRVLSMLGAKRNDRSYPPPLNR